MHYHIITVFEPRSAVPEENQLYRDNRLLFLTRKGAETASGNRFGDRAASPIARRVLEIRKEDGTFIHYLLELDQPVQVRQDPLPQRPGTLTFKEPTHIGNVVNSVVDKLGLGDLNNLVGALEKLSDAEWDAVLSLGKRLFGPKM